MRPSFLAVAFVVSIAFLGCGGQSDGDSSFDSSVAVAPGDSCGAPGATAPASDGCNTCSCDDDAWSCTEVACSAGCQEGATKEAGDGCNTCGCSGGEWACSQRACGVEPTDDPPPMGCPAPREPAPNVRCAQVEVHAQSPETGLCCPYGNSCVSPEGWAVFSTLKECQGGGAVCTPGETMNDGCNSCTCTDDGWACTDLACPEKCVPGTTRRAEDGCNVCTCGDDALWGGCTLMLCEPETAIHCGGWSGDTCTDDEYCAFVDGQLCGAADASATCEKRPEACTLELAPVCGCDGNVYSNACAANAAGVGLLSIGECVQP